MRKNILGEFDKLEISNSKKTQLENKLKSAIKNAWPRYHFIQKDDNLINNKIIDFEIVVSVPIDSFSKDYRVCRLESPYKEELIHRYSHHTMRIGTKDIPGDTVQEIITKCLSHSNN